MGALPDDRLDAFASDLGPSEDLDLTTSVARTGRLKPGAYMIQLIESGSDVAWIRVGPYSASAPPTATTDVPSTPFGGGGPVAFTLHVRPNHNDQVSGIMASGTGRLIFTKTSRVPRRA